MNDHYTLSYHVRNEHQDAPPRVVDVQASRAQIQQFADEGYFVRERMIDSELLENLRNAVDDIENEERDKQNKGGQGGFGGLFVRNLLDRHPAFLEMLNYEPTLSVARALLGPQVQVHAFVMRVAYPGEGQQVEWHFHQRVVPEPIPPFFNRPVVVDNLIYLDDTTLDNGPLVVLPRTHLHDNDLYSGDYGDKDGQIVLNLPAGSCVTSHSSLWHRAMMTQPTGTRRRLLILAYSQHG